MKKKKKEAIEEAPEVTVKRKLHPQRFPGMSGKMAAIVGCIVGESYTDPAFVALTVTSDDFVLGMLRGDIGYNEFIGAGSDLRNNWARLLDCAGLTGEEREEAGRMFSRMAGEERAS